MTVVARQNSWTLVQRLPFFRYLMFLIHFCFNDFHSFATSCSSFISDTATSILSLPHVTHSFLVQPSILALPHVLHSFLVQRLPFFRYLMFLIHFWHSDFHSFATSCSSFISGTATSILSLPCVLHSVLVQRLPFFRYLVFFTHY